MKTVTAFEAKTHFSKLLEEASRGESICITKHGTPVAQLTPWNRKSDAELAEMIESWRAYRKSRNITLGGLSLREMIEEGRM